jgi:hypothetical protein
MAQKWARRRWSELIEMASPEGAAEEIRGPFLPFNRFESIFPDEAKKREHSRKPPVPGTNDAGNDFHMRSGGGIPRMQGTRIDYYGSLRHFE